METLATDVARIERGLLARRQLPEGGDGSMAAAAGWGRAQGHTSAWAAGGAQSLELRGGRLSRAAEDGATAAVQIFIDAHR
jgi:hypothetical protein